MKNNTSAFRARYIRENLLRAIRDGRPDEAYEYALHLMRLYPALRREDQAAWFHRRLAIARRRADITMRRIEQARADRRADQVRNHMTDATCAMHISAITAGAQRGIRPSLDHYDGRCESAADILRGRDRP